MADIDREQQLLQAALREHEQQLDAEVARFEQAAAQSVTPPGLDEKIQALISRAERPRRAPRRIPRWVWAAATAACLLVAVYFAGPGLPGGFSGNSAAEAPAASGETAGEPEAGFDGAETPEAEEGAEAGDNNAACRPGWLPEGFTPGLEGRFENAGGQYILIVTTGGRPEEEPAGDQTYERLTLNNRLWYIKESGGRWELVCYSGEDRIALITDLPREDALKVAENLIIP